MVEQVNWFERMGFRPVVRKGPFVSVSGTGGLVGLDSEVVEGGAYEQTRMALAKVTRSLESVGASLMDVTHTRIYVRNVTDWSEVGRAHGEVFAETEVAMTMVGADLVDPDMLVELEVAAWSPQS